MGQVAFDTQEFVETLENAGLPKDQARAISIAVRKSNEVADVVTKADIVEVNCNIADVSKDMILQSEKTDAKIAEVKRYVAEVRKDLAFDIADARKEAAALADRTDAKIALLRKDVESLTNKLIIRMGGMVAAIVGIATAIIKLF